MLFLKTNKNIYFLFFIFCFINLFPQQQTDSISLNNILKKDSTFLKNIANTPLSTDTTKKIVSGSTIKQTVENMLPSTSVPAKTDITKNKNLKGFISEKISRVLPDSNTKKKLFKKVIPKTYGNISAGYDYGVIPFASNANYPMGYFSTQGSVGVSALGLPLIATYYYSTLKNVSGLNNYFRISFDATKFKNMVQNDGLQKIEDETKELSLLSSLKQTMIQKLSFAQSYQNSLPTTSSLINQLPNLKNKYLNLQTDSLLDINKPNLSDTTLTNTAKDSLGKLMSSGLAKKIVGDSINKITSLINKCDSISGKIEQYKSHLQQIDEKIKVLNNKIAYFKNPQNVVENNPYIKKYQSFVSGIKKFDIGMSYPNYSTFLVSGSTIKGINFEWEKKFYIAFTYGKTINTVMTTNNVIQNQLQTARNLYNFFDFGNVKDARKIMAFKLGYGKKESTHLYIGVLYGLGLPSYTGASTQTGVEKNLVIEIDGRIAINKANTVDIIYGKSAIYQNGTTIDPTTNTEVSNSQSLFSSFRSNAGMIKYISDIKKTKTKISLMGKIVDPFFNSYGVGFMRSDNLRYEFKIDQEITSKIKISGFYRKDRDNLLNAYSSTTNLQTMGITLNAKFNKQLSLKASYLPVVQNITTKDSVTQHTHQINNITTAVVTYVPKLKGINTFFNAIFSYYQLSGTAGKSNNFQNYNITNSTIINQHFKTNIAFNYFLNNDADSLNRNTALASLDVSYTTKKGITFTLGGKYAHNNAIKNQAGGIVKINIPIIKYIALEIYAEKLVLGDFYNSYNIAEIKRFPFYGYGKLIINW